MNRRPLSPVRPDVLAFHDFCLGRLGGSSYIDAVIASCNRPAQWPHRRLPRPVAFLGTVCLINVLLLVIWIVSFCATWEYASMRGFAVSAYAGQLALYKWDSSNNSLASTRIPGWRLQSTRNQHSWRPSIISGNGWLFITVPLWPLVPTGITVVAWLIVVVRCRPQLGQCAGCGYNLIALRGRGIARCPECGRGSDANPDRDLPKRRTVI